MSRISEIVTEMFQDGQLFLGMGEYAQTMAYDELLLWFDVLFDDEHILDDGDRVERKVGELLTALYYGTVGYTVTEHTDEDNNNWIYVHAHT
ncbi:hypothetical protein [Methanopyrus sp.]